MSRLSEEQFATEVRSRSAARWSQPEVFDRSCEESAKALDRALLGGRVLNAYNPIDVIADGLFELNHPGLIDDENSRQNYIQNERFQNSEYGRWVLYPWSSDLLRFPDPQDYHELRTYRFQELITREEIAKLQMGRVAVIGMSLGGNVAASLARNGVGGELFMSDLASPSVANLGRAEMDVRDLIHDKVSAVAKRISYIDPFMRQKHEINGITPETIDSLRSFRPDVVVDEVDDMKTSALIRMFCREEGTAYVTVSDVHDAAVLEVCRHDLSNSTPIYAKGVKDDIATQLLANQVSPRGETDIFAKSVGYTNLTPRLVDSGLEVGSTLAGLPQLGNTALGAAGVAVAAVRDIILERNLATGRYRTPLSHARGQTSWGEWLRVMHRYLGHQE